MNALSTPLGALTSAQTQLVATPVAVLMDTHWTVMEEHAQVYIF